MEQVEAAETAGDRWRGEEGRGVGADGDEAGDADIEQAGLPPLQVEAEADQPIGQRGRQEEGSVTDEVEDHPRGSEEAGRADDENGHQDQESDGAAEAGTDQRHGRGFGETDDEAAGHRARHRADAAEDRRGEERQQQVEAHIGPDLHSEADHDAGGPRRAHRRSARWRE